MKIFKRKAPTIILDEGMLSSKVVLVGMMGKPKIGVFRVCKYKDGLLHDYGEEITEEKIGEPLVTILFGSRDGIKKLADSLYNLYEQMEGEENG